MEIFKKKWLFWLFLTYTVTTTMHLPHFSKDIMSFHSWRQTQTQSTINNFYEEDMNIFHPRRNNRGNGEGIKRMEFPLMQWMIAGIYHLSGRSVLVSRLFVFLLSLLSILGIYVLIYLMFDKPLMAIFGAWTFCFSPSFYFYSINPQPDNMALTASIWALAFFYSSISNKKNIPLWISGTLFALATLIKLPFIAFYALPFTYFLIQFRKKGTFKIKELTATFSFAILPVAWYAWVIPQWDSNPIIWGMFESKDGISTLLYYFQFNLFSTLPELLLNYGSVLFFLAAFYFLFKKKIQKKADFFPWLILGIVLISYYIFEANAIAKVHDYYLFPFLPVLFVLVAYGAYHFYHTQAKSTKALVLLILIYLPIGCHLRMQNRWNPESPGFNPDLLRYKTELRELVPDSSLVIAGNDISRCIFFYYIDKKGWGFAEDNLNREEFERMIKEGAEYLYTDSKKLSHEGDLADLLKEPIAEFESIRVYKLK